MRQRGVETIRRQANAHAQQLGDILSDFAGESANATAKALTSAACRPRVVAIAAIGATYSMTSVARARRIGGMVKPKSFSRDNVFYLVAREGLH